MTTYARDRVNLGRLYDGPFSGKRAAAIRGFYEAWQGTLGRIPFEKLDQNGKVDYLLFQSSLRYELRQQSLQEARWREIEPLLPFAAEIVSMYEARQRAEDLDPAKAATALARLDKQVRDLTAKMGEAKAKRTSANRASAAATQIRSTLKRWFEFYNEYDPMFTWWAAAPYKALDKSLETYSTQLREKLAGVKPADRDTILGDPVGRDSLMNDLTSELIPYTPEELVQIAEKEFAWCLAEMKRASRDLGYGEEWKKALEHVKTLYVPPGKQVALVRDLANEAMRYVEDNKLVSVPQLAKFGWRVQMMTPERQRVNPFFTGGEVLSVSYPTSTMTHEQKMMSMRGNNIHFSRATVFHEVIPGHHLQLFMNQRYRPYRSVFNTPFSIEGWALYWEMVLWDRGFPKTPENRIGMLFWRMHRCARIIFSLSFHLEKMTAKECVDFLVERVGHEYENAAAEVRRSFETSYEPLYQSAYMLGALQFRSLRKELVDSGKMPERDFHDAILRLNSIPVTMVRATFLNQPLTRDGVAAWRYYER
ncbi:MAG: DUF885 family protein [Acidobacteria bacterium]|nr:DUF885 family protein [Acidobacteriota bacterium]